MKPERTASEQRFERYLDEHGYEHDHHPDLGVRKRPDYLVCRDGAEAVCEVKEFETTAIRERVEAGGGHASMGPQEVLGAVRGAIKTAAGQLSPLKGRGLPLVIVLANPQNADVHLDARNVALAMYGNPAFAVPVGPGAPPDARPRFVADRDGQLTTNHRYVSAVVVVHEPSLEQEHLDDLAARSGDSPRTFDEANTSALAFLAEAQAARDRGEVPSGTRRWLDVFHTISSVTGDAVALPPDWFGASGDVVWRFDAGGNMTGARCP